MNNVCKKINGGSYMDDKELMIQKLKSAVADEWFAFIQYITAANIAAGFMRESIANDLRENAMEELEHLEKLMNRLQQMDTLPPVDPASWSNITKCGIIVPKTINTIQLVKDSLKSEECAIKVYNNIATFAKDINDHATYEVILDILEDEEEHRFEMKQFLQDFAVMKKSIDGGT